MRRFRLITLLAILALHTGCSESPKMDTAAAMKSSLIAAIPTGTSVGEAESRLKARGFTVSHENDSVWVDKQHLDYLYGEMGDGGIVQRVWHVAVFHQQGAVTGIDVNTGLVGP